MYAGKAERQRCQKRVIFCLLPNAIAAAPIRCDIAAWPIKTSSSSASSPPLLGPLPLQLGGAQLFQVRVADNADVLARVFVCLLLVHGVERLLQLDPLGDALLQVRLLCCRADLL